MLAVALAAVAGCAVRAQPGQNLKIAPSDLRDFVRTICLDETMLPEGIADPAKRQEQLEFVFTQILGVAGYAVVDSEKTRAAIVETSRREGGSYDPLTGQRSQERHDQVSRAAFRELHERFGCDAVLVSRVVVVTAPWANGVATWDGVTDTLRGGRQAFGTVGALSLRVLLFDLEVRELYYGVGGIQVLSHVSDGFLRSSFAEVPHGDLLTAGDRLYGAVQASLAGLPRGSVVPPP